MELDFKAILDKPVLLSGKDATLWIMDGGVSVGHLAFEVSKAKPDAKIVASLRKVVDANVGWVMDLDVVWTTPYLKFLDRVQNLDFCNGDVTYRKNILAVCNAIHEHVNQFTEAYVIWHDERTPTMVMYSNAEGRLMFGSYDPDIKINLGWVRQLYQDIIQPHVQPGDHRLFGGELLAPPPVEEPTELDEAVMGQMVPTPSPPPKRPVRDFIAARRAQGWRTHYVVAAIILGHVGLTVLYQLIF